MTQRGRRARRRVDTAHQLAARQSDPVAYLRQQQRAAEEAYATSGDPDELALCRAFDQSLNPEGGDDN